MAFLIDYLMLDAYYCFIAAVKNKEIGFDVVFGEKYYDWDAGC